MADRDDYSNRDIANTIQTIVVELFKIIAQPSVLVTRTLFRKKLGERYFSQVHAVICMLVIAAATASSVDTESYGYRVSTLGLIVGIAWGVAFLFCAVMHRHIEIPTRWRQGERWHSRSAGIPRHSLLNPRIEQGIVLVLGLLAAWLHLHGIAALLFLSFMLTGLSDAASAAQFWNRVLDSVDGEIDAEELGKAVEQRLKPEQASGVKVCVPSCLSKASRRKVAAILTRSKNPAVLMPSPRSQAEPAKPENVTETKVARPALVAKPQEYAPHPVSDTSSNVLQSAASVMEESTPVCTTPAAAMPTHTDRPLQTPTAAVLSEPSPRLSMPSPGPVAPGAAGACEAVVRAELPTATAVLPESTDACAPVCESVPKKQLSYPFSALKVEFVLEAQRARDGKAWGQLDDSAHAAVVQGNQLSRKMLYKRDPGQGALSESNRGFNALMRSSIDEEQALLDIDAAVRALNRSADASALQLDKDQELAREVFGKMSSSDIRGMTEFWTETLDGALQSLLAAEREYSQQPARANRIACAPEDIVFPWAERFDLSTTGLLMHAGDSPELAAKVNDIYVKRRRCLNMLARLKEEYPGGQPRESK